MPEYSGGKQQKNTPPSDGAVSGVFKIAVRKCQDSGMFNGIA